MDFVGGVFRVLAAVCFQRHLGRSACTGTFFEAKQLTFEAMPFAGEMGEPGVETIHVAAGDGDFPFGFEVQFGLVPAVRRTFGDGGKLVANVVVFGGLETPGVAEIGGEFIDEALVEKALGLPVGVELVLQVGVFVGGFAGEYVAADGVEAVFASGGLGT
ncbi:MAG: hypothetical protein ACKV2U_32615 [Bryobacteraceae bacterium]